jgi:radical SAM superfamily enzyme YgiQ (UPF0313 family)
MPVRLLHGVLEQAGHEPKSIFFKRHRLDRMAPPTDAEYELLHRTLDELQPDFVGFSLRSTFATVAKRIAARLRADGHLVVWGGTHATVAPEDCVDYADGICTGEGEGVLLDLAERLDNGRRDLGGIPNLWARENGTGDLVQAPTRPLIDDLDSVAWPWYEDENCYYIENDEVSYALPAGFMTSYDLMTSRGCPYRCEFCCHSVMAEKYKGLGKYLRRRSPESVIRELEWARQRFPTVNRIRFWDDVFPAVNMAWLEEFSELYRERVRLPFWCYTYPSTSRTEILDLLFRAGLRYLGMGIQSGSERIRTEVFNRPSKTEEIIEAGRNFSQFDIHPEYDLICDNPFETEEDFRETLEVMLAMPRPFSVFQHSLAFFPNYPMTRKAIERGYIEPNDVEHVTGKGYIQWHDEFSHARKPEHVFWVTIFYLTQFSLVPRPLIRALAGSRFFREHPILLNKLVKPLGRAGERLRWIRLYVKERGMRVTLGRYLKKLTLAVRSDNAGARAVWGAD